MSRGGKREGAGRRSTVNNITRLLVGARAKTLLDQREVVPRTDLLALYIQNAQDILHAIPIEKRRGYPTVTQRWVAEVLDSEGRCSAGKALTVQEVLEIVAKEFGLKPRQVRTCLEWYRRQISRNQE